MWLNSHLTSVHGRGVQSLGRSDPTEPARRALSRGRTDVERARGALLNDALRGDEAPEAARGRWARGHQTTRPQKAPLPEPRPDPSRPRSVGEQVRLSLIHI